MLRPSSLEAVPLMSFVAVWERKKSNQGLQFQSHHPLFGSHSLYRRAKPSIVSLSHSRLPDVRRDDLSAEDRLRFQRSIAVLFRPFRDVEELTRHGANFDSFFLRWWDHEAPPAARMFVDHNADYFASRDAVDKQADPDVARYGRYEGCSDEEDGAGCAYAYSDDDEDAEDRFTFDNDCDSDEEVMVPTQQSRHIDLIENASCVAALSAKSTVRESTSFPAIEMDIDAIQELVRDLDKVEKSRHDASSELTLAREESIDLPTRVQILQKALRDSQNPPPAVDTNGESEGVECLDDKPSLCEVSSACHLNQKQHEMFVLAGTKLLASLIVGHDPADQLIGFLDGLPGAGKSRVIAALQCLARRWDSSEAVATAAYQGVAAQAADGQTIHKLFGWSVHSKKKWTPTQAQRDRFSRLKLLILDEVSTCDVTILGMVDASLRRILDRPSQVFGGVHVLLVGDWLQQLLVAGQPAYLPVRSALRSARTTDASADYLDQVRGVKAYQSINTVVILDENMRHRGDPVWRSILDKWRVGDYQEPDIELVKKFAHRENWTSATADLKGYCPIIVTSNALRVEFNASAVRAFCTSSQVPLHRFPADVTRRRHPLSRAHRNSLLGIRDDKTGNMPMMLEVALGSTVQCTKNISPALKLANGSIGIVVAMTASEGDEIQVTSVDGIEVHTHSLPPSVVFVKLKDFEAHQFLPELPEGVVPVCKRVEKSVSITMAHRSFNVTISQVPLVPAYSLTTEKCQGLTVEKMVLAPLRHHTRRVPQRSSFYVAVTRVKSLQQLYLMAPLNLQYLSYFVPPDHALEETRKLQSKEHTPSG